MNATPPSQEPMPSAALQQLGKAIAGAPDAPTPVQSTPPPAQFIRGVVEVINLDGTLGVSINGAPADPVTGLYTQCERLAHVVVTVGTTVELHVFGTRMVVDGALAVTNVAPGSSGLLPIGGSCPFFGTSVPTNFLLMDGSAFSGSTYPALAAVLGTTVLPDARGRVIAGTGSVGTNSQPTLTLGAVGG
jgi:hypothetical protein